MKNFEKYIDEIIDKSNVDYIAHFYGNMETCSDCKGKKDCFDCLGSRVERVKKWLLQEYKEPIKLKQWEFDVCLAVKKYTSYETSLRLNNCIILTDLLEKGYFKGVTDTSMTIREILENCEIVSDDYEGFEDCK